MNPLNVVKSGKADSNNIVAVIRKPVIQLKKVKVFIRTRVTKNEKTTKEKALRL